VTPTQLRAFASVVRLGSVKAAADELEVSESAVSMHIAQLRRELDDKLFTRTASGLAFTPGGLRLAGRAVEILGLQDRTVREVSQAGSGRRLLRIAASSLFAEHAAPGLIELFAGRAADLDVELSVHQTSRYRVLLAARTVDIVIGRLPRQVPDDLLLKPFLDYDVLAVARPDHPLTHGPADLQRARQLNWLVGPSADDEQEVVQAMLRQLAVPEKRQRIFQSDAAAIEETKRSDGIGLALRFAVAGDIAAGRLAPVQGPGLRARSRWAAAALPPHSHPPATAELLTFLTTPRATQAMVRGAGASVGRFKPSVHVTLWN
jgi:DNA-binding transcriptional LysR family regulator